MKKLPVVFLIVALASGLLIAPRALTQNGPVGLKLPEVQTPSPLSMVVILPAENQRVITVWEKQQMRACLETNFLRPDEKRWPSAKKFCLVSGEALLPWDKPRWLGMAGQYNSSYQIGAPATVAFGPVIKIGTMGESWVVVKYFYSWDELHRRDRVFLIQLKLK